jgi:hypothetical protein
MGGLMSLLYMHWRSTLDLVAFSQSMNGTIRITQSCSEELFPTHNHGQAAMSAYYAWCF